MVLIRDCDEDVNLIKPTTREEKVRVWNKCMVNEFLKLLLFLFTMLIDTNEFY